MIETSSMSKNSLISGPRNGPSGRAGSFFEKVRSTEMVSLYNNEDVWKVFGYQGASYRFGGYLHHGFNDLNWLPDPPETASPKPT